MWYKENFKKLSQKYGLNYIAIKDKKVIANGQSCREAIKKAEEITKLGTFIFQKCGNDSSAYTNYISSMNFVPSKFV